MIKNHKSFIFVAIFVFIISLFSLPKNTNALAQGVCKKSYYLPTDIVGYFVSSYDHESYYITTDWCVVKSLLWYGTVFGHYMINEADLDKNMAYMFPDPQVYFGLIPNYFLNDGGGRPRRGAFTTTGQKGYGYFLNDNPFKNIFGGNFPKPPRYVPDPKMGYGILEAQGWAQKFQKRMAELHDIFSKYIVNGYCRIPEFASKFTAICDYFSVRTVPFSPGQYQSFNKLPELKRNQ